jgi:hypothetical protein
MKRFAYDAFKNKIEITDVRNAADLFDRKVRTNQTYAQAAKNGKWFLINPQYGIVEEAL